MTHAREIEVTIRPEEPPDVDAIDSLTTRAFAESPLGHHGEAELVARLRAACPDSISLVAEVDEQVVGHILFTPAGLERDGDERTGMGLAPMSVLPELQGRGIGSRLVRRGLEVVREAGALFVVVLGHPEFYPRFGFTPAPRHGISCEFVSPDSDAFMVLFFAGDPTGGVVKYHPGFG